jgi:transposase-like protein
MQNYLCKKCERQFIGGHVLRYKACHSSPAQKILLMLVRGIVVNYIDEIERISIKTIADIATLPAYDPAQAAIL